MPCEYTLTIFSSYGCPSECNRYDNQICGGNGLCGYDFMSLKPKCFCFYGYSGDDCMGTISDNRLETLYKSTKTLPEEHVEAGFTHTFTSEETGSVSVTYDLIDLQIDEGVYIVHDRNKRYQVLYLGLVPLVLPKYDQTPSHKKILPDCCNDIRSPCAEMNETTKECVRYKDVTWGLAFLVDFSLGTENCTCKVLSTDVPTWELYDKGNPTRGVTIVYPNGSWCAGAGINFCISLYFFFRW